MSKHLKIKNKPYKIDALLTSIGKMKVKHLAVMCKEFLQHFVSSSYDDTCPFRDQQ
jgi:hypothetical protein